MMLICLIIICVLLGFIAILVSNGFHDMNRQLKAMNRNMDSSNEHMRNILKRLSW